MIVKALMLTLLICVLVFNPYRCPDVGSGHNPGRESRAEAQTVTGSIDKSQPGFPIAFTFDPLLQPKIIVQVSVNGQAPLPFWVDTGLTAPLIIDKQAAEKLNLIVDPNSSTVPIGSIQTHQIDLSSLAFSGNGPGENFPIHGVKTALVGDLTLFQSRLALEHISGMIGISAFADSAVRFDFDTHVMTLYPRLRKSTSNRHIFTLPLQTHEGDGRYYVTVRFNKDISTELLLDTGAEDTGIPISIAQHLHPIAMQSVGTGTAYGLSVTPSLLLSSLYLGDCKVDQVAVDSLPQTPAGFPLGINILDRFCVTMDFPNKQLLLECSAHHPKQGHHFGYTGIYLEQLGEMGNQEGAEHITHKSSSDKNSFVVAKIDAGSPAEQAGVKKGDIVSEIDSRTLLDLSSLDTRKLLNGFADKRIHLLIQRQNGQFIPISFQRASEFARPPLPVDGLFLSIPFRKPMEIVGLLQGCVAKKAGLQQGDVIQEFNGFADSELTPAILANEFRKTRLTLRVKRPGNDALLYFSLTAASNAAKSPAQ